MTIYNIYYLLYWGCDKVRELWQSVKLFPLGLVGANPTTPTNINSPKSDTLN